MAQPDTDPPLSSTSDIRSHLQYLLDEKEKQLQQAGTLGQRVLAQHMELEERIRELQAVIGDNAEGEGAIDPDPLARDKLTELAETSTRWDRENAVLSNQVGKVENGQYEEMAAPDANYRLSPTSDIHSQLQSLLEAKERQLQQAGTLGQQVLAQQMELEERIGHLREMIGDSMEGTNKSGGFEGGVPSQEAKEKLTELTETLARWDQENVALSGQFGKPPASSTGSPSETSTAERLDAPSSAAAKSRRAKNAAHRADDVEFAFEIGSGLLTEVRRLQSILAERDKVIQDMKEERDDLEAQLKAGSGPGPEDITRESKKENDQEADDTARDVRTRLERPLFGTKERPVESLRTERKQQQEQAQNTAVKSKEENRMERGAPDNTQHTIDFSGLLLASAEPHKQLLELLEANGWSKESLVEWLQAESRKSIADSTYRRKCMKCLDAVVKRYHVFPSSFFIMDIVLDGNRPKKRGGFADIFRGTIGSQKVCLKLLRMYLDYDEDKRKEIITSFCKEVLLWTQLSHHNILPLIGVNSDIFKPEFCLVSPWMSNDDIISFLKKNPDHDRLQSICDIAAGIEYLHSLNPVIVHGDIKGGNVLVDENLNCVLSDFGLSRTIFQTAGASTSTTLGGSVRWMAPELFGYDEADGDKQYMSPRDIYAFACTILEIMTGKPPFSELLDGGVIHQVIILKKRPPRPTDGWCPDDIWNLATACWQEDPSQRPGAISINAYLTGLKEGTHTGRSLLLKHLVDTPEKWLGVAETINSLVAMGFSRYDVHEQMHKYDNNTKLVMPILTRAARENAKRTSEDLLYTSVAAVTLIKRHQTHVYYQIPNGDITETGGDGLKASTIVKAPLFTPLAVITFRDGEEIRVYYLDQDSILQEHCRSGDGQWYRGDLGDLKIQAGFNASLAASCWSTDDNLRIRVFYQDFHSNTIRGVGRENDGPWRKLKMSIPDALQGTALSTALQLKGTSHLQIYYQDVKLSIRGGIYADTTERWHPSEHQLGQAPHCTPICVTGGSGNLTVWWRNGRGEIVRSRWYGSHPWVMLGALVTGRQPGTNFAVVDGDASEMIDRGLGAGGATRGRPLTRVYCQNSDARVVAVAYDEVEGLQNSGWSGQWSGLWSAIRGGLTTS